MSIEVVSFLFFFFFMNLREEIVVKIKIKQKASALVHFVYELNANVIYEVENVSCKL